MTPEELMELGIETRIIEAELLADDGEDMKGKGRAAVSKIGSVDTYGDLIEKGAFGTRTTTVDMLPNHSWDSPYPPIGMMGVKEEEKSAPDVVGMFALNLKTILGNEWLNHLTFRKKQQFSIGFRVPKGGARWIDYEERKKRKDGAWRIISKLELLEVSMVVAGAMKGTRLLELRAARPKHILDPELRRLVDDTSITVPIGRDLKSMMGLGLHFPHRRFSK